MISFPDANQRRTAVHHKFCRRAKNIMIAASFDEIESGIHRLIMTGELAVNFETNSKGEVMLQCQPTSA